MSTLKDIAQRANVSVTTVSHVLNKTRFVSDEIQARVNAAIHELQYRPNRLAQGLRRQQTKIIGFIAPLLITEATASFCMRVLQGVCSVLNEQNYSVILGDNSHCIGLEQQNEVLRDFRAQMVDGLVLLPGPINFDLRFIRDSVGADLPVVVVDHEAEGLFDSVQVDSENSYCDLVTLMIEQGHRQIGVITGELTPGSAYYHRYLGYCRAMAAHGIPISPDLVKEDKVTEQNGYLTMQRLLTQPLRPTAVVLLSNVMALGAVSYINEKNVHMPGDLAVVVIDNYAWSRMTIPPLTVIDQPTYLLGQRAAQLLLHRISDPNAPPAVVREPLQLIRRGSF